MKRPKAARRVFAGILALAGIWMALAATGAPSGWVETFAPAGAETEKVPWWQRVLLGDSSLLAQWAADGHPEDEDKPEETSPGQAEKLQPPANIQERTISGGAGYVTGGGVSLFNRTGKTVDLDAVAQAGTSFSLSVAENGPQILIMHTHTTESYTRDPDAPYTETGTAHTTDTNYNIVQVGEEITRVLTEMGFNVIHDTQVYDYPSYNGAYERSRAGVEAILEQYPTIQMVLDIHRDALVDANGTIYKPVVTVDGEKTAQVMLLVGTDDAGASFPDWTEHLALAMDIYKEMNSLWPGLARPITLRTARFNQQLTKGSLLVEVGSHGNTLEEALAGARLFARSLGKVLLERVYS